MRERGKAGTRQAGLNTNGDESKRNWDRCDDASSLGGPPFRKAATFGGWVKQCDFQGELSTIPKVVEKATKRDSHMTVHVFCEAHVACLSSQAKIDAPNHKPVSGDYITVLHARTQILAPSPHQQYRVGMYCGVRSKRGWVNTMLLHVGLSPPGRSRRPKFTAAASKHTPSFFPLPPFNFLVVRFF